MSDLLRREPAYFRRLFVLEGPVLDQFLSSLSFVDIFNGCVFVAFSVCYAYQIFYVFVTLTKKPPQLTAKKNHRYAAVICARNENAVIGDLIHSIRVQNYPQELIDIFVVADNCTDNTAAVAQEAGAIVFPGSTTRRSARGTRSTTVSPASASTTVKTATRPTSSSMPTTCST